MDILTSVPSYPDDTRTTSAPQYVANSAESIKTTAPTPTQQDASFPGPRTVPAPQYALAQQHPNYGYDQSGVDGPRDQLEMETGSGSTPSVPETAIVTKRVLHRRRGFWGLMIAAIIIIIIMIVIALRLQRSRVIFLGR